MPAIIPFYSRIPISLCIFKPAGHCLDDLVEYLTYLSNWFESAGYLQSFILKSVHGNTVVWCGAWTNLGADVQKTLSDIPLIQEFRKMVSPLAHIVDISWFETYLGEANNGIPIAKISRGDIVMARAFVAKSQKQDSLSYACLALVKSFFPKIKGARSCTLFRSLDGVKVAGFVVWKELKQAYDWILNPTLERYIEPYVEELIVDSKYDIMKVVYATGDWKQLPPSPPLHHRIEAPTPC